MYMGGIFVGSRLLQYLSCKSRLSIICWWSHSPQFSLPGCGQTADNRRVSSAKVEEAFQFVQFDGGD
jgi:hypothetical protein